MVMTMLQEPEMLASLLPDLLTCGHCLAHFRLDDIIAFIQHKAVHVRTVARDRQQLRGRRRTGKSREGAPENAEDGAAVPGEMNCSLCGIKCNSPSYLIKHLALSHSVSICTS